VLAPPLEPLLVPDPSPCVPPPPQPASASPIHKASDALGVMTPLAGSKRCASFGHVRESGFLTLRESNVAKSCVARLRRLRLHCRASIHACTIGIPVIGSLSGR
jgi:hypothetical protein